MEIVDSNVLFGFWPKRNLLADLNSVKQTARGQGVTKMMVTSMRGIFDDYERGNDETYAACNVDPALIPVLTLNPCRFLGVDHEIGKWQELGLNIFRFFPDYQNWPYAYAPFRQILKKLAPRHPLIILPARVGGHGKNGVISEIGNLAAANPAARFLITGAYYGNLAEAIVVAQEQANIMLETHLVNSPEGIRVLAQNVGVDRLVFGSEMPLNYLGSALESVTKTDLPDQSKAMILSQNALRIAHARLEDSK